MHFRRVGAALCPAIMALVISCELDLLSDTSGEDGITAARVAQGLKEALAVGIDSAATRLGDSARGYLVDEAVRIALPEDVAGALDYVERLEQIPLAGQVLEFAALTGLRDSLRTSINRAAEKAAPMSVGIFKNAITAMTIEDARGILNGDSTEATDYLRERTLQPLTDLYSPFVDSTLELVGAHQLWKFISTNYNDLVTQYTTLNALALDRLPEPAYDSLTTNLASYTTEYALKGLFLMVGREETRIRFDPLARVTEILEEVFGLLDRREGDA